MAHTNSTTVEASEYDMINRADGYEAIEEVDAINDILFLDVPPRHGPLPTPGYSGLMPDEPKPPGVYSRMDHPEKIVWGSDVDRNDPKSEISGSMHDLSSPPEPEINTIGDIAAECEQIPSTHLMVTSATEAVQ